MINCIQLYEPETLLIEYDQDYSEDDIKNLFKEERIFHIKIYSYCSFVHFYSHDGKSPVKSVTLIAAQLQSLNITETCKNIILNPFTH
jgi:hypothetical protein